MQYGPAWLFYESPLDNPFGDEQRAVDFLPFLKHPKSRVPDIATCSYGMFSSCGLLPSKKANCLVRWKLSCLSLKLLRCLSSVLPVPPKRCDLPDVRTEPPRRALRCGAVGRPSGSQRHALQLRVRAKMRDHMEAIACL
jgi:hypothetical protein